MNKWKIYFLLFGFALCCGLFGILSKNAFAVESYKISPAQDRDFKRAYYRQVYIEQDTPINLHYYFYAPDKYSEKIKLISFICEDPYNNYTTIDGCGLYMVQEAGSFKIKLKASGYTQTDYSRETQESASPYVNKVYGFSKPFEIASYTDQDFKNGLTLLGGTALKENSWNLNEGGFLVEPIGGKTDSSNSNSGNNSGGGFGDFFAGIRDFIRDFFQPMIDSITRTQKVVLGITDNIIKGISDFFAPMIQSIGNMLKAIIDLPRLILDGIKSIFDDLINAVTTLFVPAEGQIDTEMSNLKSMFNFDKITAILDATFLPVEKSGFRYDLNCNNQYWDSASDYLNENIYDKGTNTIMEKMHGKAWRMGLSICKVPPIYITIARTLLIFAFVWWSAYRLFEFVPILMGSAFIWDRWKKKEE